MVFHICELKLARRVQLKEKKLLFFLTYSVSPANQVLCQAILIFHQRNRSSAWILAFCTHIAMHLMARATFLVNLHFPMSCN